MSVQVAAVDPPTVVTGRRRFHRIEPLRLDPEPSVEPLVPEVTRWPATELTVDAILPLVDTFNASVRTRSNRWKARHGARCMLTWLATLPGGTWQQRWLHTEENYDDREWLQRALDGRADTHLVVPGLGSLIALDVVRPSYRWLANNSFAATWKRMGHLRDPEVHAKVNALAEVFTGRSREAEDALLVLAKIQAHTGKNLGQVSGQDVLDYRTAMKVIQRKHKGLVLCWRWLGELGTRNHPAFELPSARQEGTRSASDMVDQYEVSNEKMRTLLIDYLEERRGFMDYSSVQGLARNLVKHFWADIERHHPEVDSLHIPADVVAAWKQRLARLPDGRPRADVVSIYFSVRGLYIDIAQWAHHQPERWAHMVAPSPITAADTASYANIKKRQVARIHQETRLLAPILPRLVAAVESRLAAAQAFLTAVQAVAVGEAFDHDGRQWRRVQPNGSQFCYVRLVGDRHVHNLTLEEEDAFWGWALVEVLRHTGARIEEVLELTHLSVTNYLQPQTAEVVPLLHISPSKTDEERMLVAGPELVNALAMIIKRIRKTDSTVPLVPRWDGYERELGQPLPHLFQRSYGADQRVISVEHARAFLNRAAARADLRGPDGELIRFRPHDFRRIFATDAQASGLPVHIIAQLLGHKSLATTQVYTAIYPEDVIRHHRSFIVRRRQQRPGEEYREPTEEEWDEFEAHFVRRKVSLGTCGRAYGTSCQHEHACVRCALLRTDPHQIDRLRDIITNLGERIAEADERGWLGEAEGLKISLDAAHLKLAQMERQLGRREGAVLLGMPSRGF